MKMHEYKPFAEFKNGNTIISGVDNFDLRQTLDCGQAFRWSPLPDGCWSGIALGRYIKIGHADSKIILFDTDLSEYEEKWRNYFDVDRDYSVIVSSMDPDKILSAAAHKNSGIRILRQDKWETLCSFIISQNNNIPRIKGIIGRLCEQFGEPVDGGFAFPAPQKLACLTPDDLAPLRSGFRARYIIDAAKKVTDGTINTELIANSDNDTARKELMKITGVGAKVADCTLLFGYSHLDVLPKDVWIKRALTEYFGGELPECALPYAGIAQQYIFNYIRDENGKF